ncbi:MAG TPA: GGDEF domain-containing protein [Acidimicrobiales bacterium]|nr:GGDEF domain-containing protein [Acidimicrobiales bacterium]
MATELPAAKASVARRTLRYAARASFPLAVLLLGLAYLLVQGRIDRRDPKLATAAVRSDRWLAFEGTGVVAAGRPDGAGLVSLDERLRSMQLARAALAGLALALAAVFRTGVDHPSLPRLLAAGVAYCLVAVSAGLVWRATRRRSLIILGGLFTLDGVFLVWVTLITGGVTSPLQYLVPLYVATVALVASYRTGVRVAVWNSLLAVGAYYGAAAGLLPGGRPAPGSFDHLVAFVVVVWVTAVVTATFSAMNERELRRRRFHLEVLHTLAVALEQAPTGERVAGAALDAAVDGLGFRRGVVVASVGGRHEVLAARGAASTQAEAEPDDLLQRARLARSALLVEQVDPEANPWLQRVLPGASGVVVVPLATDTPEEAAVAGALVVEHGGPRVDRSVLSTLEQVGAHAALAIGNRLLLDRVRALASTDGLTGLANRRSFDAGFDREVARAARTGAALSLVMVDIDHFKRLNDGYGHAFGDEVLRRVAEAIRSAVRPYDLVARYGGEEIAVVLAGCGPRRAARTAERIRAAVAALDLVTPLTVSAGVASLLPLEAPDDMLRRADAALYRSKGAGRDRVTVDDGTRVVVRLDRARGPRRSGTTAARRAAGVRA